MNRADFINKTIRYLLMAAITFVVLMLGRKVVYSSDCNSCPQNGTCSRLNCTPPTPQGGLKAGI